MNVESRFEYETYYTGPPLTAAAIEDAEKALGFRLPASYLDVLSEKNGGVLRARCFRTNFQNSWAPDHIEIRTLLGIGGEWGIDSKTGLGSRDLILEWGYPDIGVVICDMPSGGHDTVMLDYSTCGPRGEPAVAYVDEDRIPRQLAPSFNEFLSGLYLCE